MTNPPKDDKKQEENRKILPAYNFQKGNPGGPGRPKGSGLLARLGADYLNKRDVWLKKMIDEENPLVLPFICPKIQVEKSYIVLENDSELNTLKDIHEVSKAITKSVITGEVSLEDAKAFKDILAQDRDVLRDKISEEMLKTNEA